MSKECRIPERRFFIDYQLLTDNILRNLSFGVPYSIFNKGNIEYRAGNNECRTVAAHFEIYHSVFPVRYSTRAILNIEQGIMNVERGIRAYSHSLRNLSFGVPCSIFTRTISNIGQGIMNVEWKTFIGA